MKNEIKDFKVGDDVKWSGDYFNGYKDGKDITDLRLTVTGDIKLEDVVLNPEVANYVEKLESKIKELEDSLTKTP